MLFNNTWLPLRIVAVPCVNSYILLNTFLCQCTWQLSAYSIRCNEFQSNSTLLRKLPLNVQNGFSVCGQLLPNSSHISVFRATTAHSVCVGKKGTPVHRAAGSVQYRSYRTTCRLRFAMVSAWACVSVCLGRAVVVMAFRFLGVFSLASMGSWAVMWHIQEWRAVVTCMVLSLCTSVYNSLLLLQLGCFSNCFFHERT